MRDGNVVGDAYVVAFDAIPRGVPGLHHFDDGCRLADLVSYDCIDLIDDLNGIEGDCGEQTVC